MKLRILSDLHIEFHPFTIPPCRDDADTVLILAGDIGVIHRQAELAAFLQAAAARFRAVIYVLGNHEYYRGIWPAARHVLTAWALPANIHVLDRACVELDGVVFVGATLWTDFDCGNPQTMQSAETVLNDFHYIEHEDAQGRKRRLTALDVYKDHQVSLAWLERTLSALHRENKRCVLVTHHGIARESIHEDYADNALNGAFVSDCSALIAQTAPVLAVHGHVHNSFDYTLNAGASPTRVIVNPRGYTRRDDTQENPFFDPCLSVDLSLL